MYDCIALAGAYAVSLHGARLLKARQQPSRTLALSPPQPGAAKGRQRDARHATGASYECFLSCRPTTSSSTSRVWCSEEEAARAYDRALWRLKPKEAHSYVNFKDEVSTLPMWLLSSVAGRCCLLLLGLEEARARTALRPQLQGRGTPGSQGASVGQHAQ